MFPSLTETETRTAVLTIEPASIGATSRRPYRPMHVPTGATRRYRRIRVHSTSDPALRNRDPGCLPPSHPKEEAQTSQAWCIQGPVAKYRYATADATTSAHHACGPHREQCRD